MTPSHLKGQTHDSGKLFSERSGPPSAGRSGRLMQKSFEQPFSREFVFLSQTTASTSGLGGLGEFK